MSETVEVNGTEVEVTETRDGYEAEAITEKVAKFTDAHNDSITVPLSDGFVVEAVDRSGHNEYVVGVYERVSSTHKSAGNLIDDDDVTYGYYFNEMELTEE